jgi:membrane fusion protein (multidrug efflux system)
MRKWVPIPLLALILLFGLWHLWGTQGQGAPDDPVKAASETGGKPSSEPSTASKAPQKGPGLPTVATELVQHRGLTNSIELTGSVTATRLARIASPGEGPILNCKVREGDVVKKGERLLLIGRNTAVQALVAASQAALKEQEQELWRVKQLVESGAIPGAQLDTARSKYESARAQVAKARESADDYSVTAPWDGIVSRVLVRDGDFVAPRSALVEMFDPDSLVVRFAVPEAQATGIRETLEARVLLDAYPGKSLRGRVSRVYPELDSRMRTRTAEAALVDPVDLIPGMFARIEVTLQSIPDAVTVPSGAVIVTPKGERIAFVLDGGKAVLQKVETGIEKEGRIQIVKGIRVGDQVIVSGNEKLKDGAEVQAGVGAAQ